MESKSIDLNMSVDFNVHGKQVDEVYVSWLEKALHTNPSLGEYQITGTVGFLQHSIGNRTNLNFLVSCFTTLEITMVAIMTEDKFEYLQNYCVTKFVCLGFSEFNIHY